MKLSEYLNEELVAVQVVAKSWQEAVRAGGELLLKADVCEPRYLDAMVDAVEQMGPYMVLAPGIALAHARPEDGVKQVGLAIINLKDPVEFGSEANDPVSLVIAFGGVDKKSHIELLQSLAALLLDEEKQKLLKTAVTVEQLLAAVRQAE